jgi:O-methyltransferase
MKMLQKLSDKAAYWIFHRTNLGNKELTNLDFKRYQQQLWGIKPKTSDRPVCKLWWPEKIDLVLRSVEQTEGIFGDVVELGTYRGGGTLLIAEKLIELNSDRRLWTFDSFCGYPTPTEFDQMDNGQYHYAEGHHNDTSAAYVRKMLQLFNISNRVNIQQGFFEEALPRCFQANCQFSLIILDCNHYASIKVCLNFFYPRLSPQSVVIIDDYRRPEQPYHPEAPGVKKAVDEFLSDKPEQLKHGAYSMWYFVKC